MPVARITKIVYLVLCVAVLVSTLNSPFSDAVDVEAIFLIALSFPSGFLVVGLYVAFTAAWMHLFGRLSNPADLEYPVVSWLLFTAVGYFQWFILIPWTWHKITGPKRSAAQPTDAIRFRT